MKIKLPEFLLCEDPTAEKEILFIYHTHSKSLIHIIHSNNLPVAEPDVFYINRKHFDYTYINFLGELQKIMFVAELVEFNDLTGQHILERCAHWYACYLGWEDDCNDVRQQS